MARSFFSDSIRNFLKLDKEVLIGFLLKSAQSAGFAPRDAQIAAWREEVSILQASLPGIDGRVLFEFTVPRVGRRADVVLVSGSAVIIIEFKVGEEKFLPGDREQVWDYALDLKNFHGLSRQAPIIPMLLPTSAPELPESNSVRIADDGVWEPICATTKSFRTTLDSVLSTATGPLINASEWERGGYSPTPTIIEAAIALFQSHSVLEISRTDAGARNLSKTGIQLDEIITSTRDAKEKAICFVTGVPGAGKTLVGLDVATRHLDPSQSLYSVYLSGNDPLVRVLCEALARDSVRRSKEAGTNVRKTEARRKVETFIQNVHHFRDDGLENEQAAPLEHVVIFDEAQRAWTLEKTRLFMSQKKARPDFGRSEPEFLISCMDRHDDWAVVICLVGGGQEINTGEAGMPEWIKAVDRSFPKWKIYASRQLADVEFGGRNSVETVLQRQGVTWRENLHLPVSIRSFRAEKVSHLVRQVLDVDLDGARRTYQEAPKFKIALTRDLGKAKDWLRRMARGSERFGIVASSKADRLKPQALFVRAKIDPVHWFLDPSSDVRSSLFLEDPATEFDVQGLELDWACVTWDADLRFHNGDWEHWAFGSDRWRKIILKERQAFQTNAYRVLLTRARQGMIIVVPEGNSKDPTRKPEFYDSTYRYLSELGLERV